MKAIWILPGLVCVYLFLIAPRIPKRRLKEPAGLYAHRGLWNGERPENSLAAFRAATEQGFGIEMDVHLTKDGQLVVFHDDSLQRMCGTEGIITERTLAELKELRLKGTEERIPTFDEFLETVAGKVPLIVEIKTCPRIEELSEKTAARLDRYPGAFSVESFDPRAVKWIRKNRPEWTRGQLTMGPGDRPKTRKALLMASQVWNVMSRPDYLACEHETDGILPLRLARLFRPHLVAWTVRSQEDLDRLKKRYEILIFDGFVPDQAGRPG